MSVVDAHVHLWDLAARPQPWTAQLPVLRRDFLLPELEKVLDDHGVDAVVVVQAGDTVGETLDLLALAGDHAEAGRRGRLGRPGRAGRPRCRGRAARRPGGGKLVAVRHQLQVEPDPGYLARPGVRDGLAAVAEAGLAYDVVVSPWQLPLVTETAAARPEARFVLDHAGKPPLAAGDLGPWRADLARLAELPNVAVKLSGLVTEADWASLVPGETCRPPLSTCLPALGPSRTMAGSDWPVCLLAAGYGAVRATLDPVLGALDPAGRADVLGRHRRPLVPARPMMQARPLRGLAVSQLGFGGASLGNLYLETPDAQARAERGRGLGRRRALLRHRAALRPRAVRTPARRGAGRTAAGRLRAVHQGRPPAGA